ncbi:MAG: isomerase [Gammaproteobacteria bacterium]
MERHQRLMICHGMLVILVAMLAGFMLMFNLVGGIEVWPGTIIDIPMYGTEAGWVRAHSGGVTNGLLVMVVGLALPKLNLGETARAWTTWGFIYIAWSFTAFYWFGNASSNRGLSIGPSALGEPDAIGLLAFLPGVPSVFLVVVLLFIGARGVMAQK